MKKFLVVFVVLITAVLLSSCSGRNAARAVSWPGLVADADNVYLADGTYVYAVSVKTGLEVWRFPESSSSTFFAQPVLTSDGQLLIGSEGTDHAFFSVDIKTGKPHWAQPFTGAKDRWLASALVLDNMIYAPNSDGFLYILDMDGNLVDKVDLGGALWSAPVTDGKMIYVASLDHHFHAVDVSTRKIVSTIELESAIPGGLAIATDGIYFGSFAKQLSVVANNQEKKVVETPNWIWSAPAIDGDTLYFADLDGNVYSYNAKSGSMNWSVKADGPITASPVVMGENIIVGTEKGVVYALSAADGSIVWSHTTGGKIYSNIVISNETILVSPMSAEFHLAGLNADGKDAWQPFTPK